MPLRTVPDHAPGRAPLHRAGAAPDGQRRGHGPPIVTDAAGRLVLAQLRQPALLPAGRPRPSVQPRHGRPAPGRRGAGAARPPQLDRRRVDRLRRHPERPRPDAEPAPAAVRSALPGGDPGDRRGPAPRRAAGDRALRPAAAPGAGDRLRQGGADRQYRGPRPPGAARGGAGRPLCRDDPRESGDGVRGAGQAARRRGRRLSRQARRTRKLLGARRRRRREAQEPGSNCSRRRRRCIDGKGRKKGERSGSTGTGGDDPRRGGEGRRRPGGDGRADARRPVRRRAYPARRPAGHGQDPPRALLRAGARARFRPDPVHPGPDAGRHHRRQPVQLPDLPSP